MGCAQSNNAAASGDAFDPSAEKESQRIDQDLKREKSLERKTTKMLLLGSGEVSYIKHLQLQSLIRSRVANPQLSNSSS
jgi:hypothetical protein